MAAVLAAFLAAARISSSRPRPITVAAVVAFTVVAAVDFMAVVAVSMDDINLCP